MERTVSPRKKLKSPGIDGTANINTKTSVTCANVPEGLFDANATKKHFSKFGRVQKIRLFPRKQMCIIEYDQPLAAERAVLNAGAYDGFMFDVTRTKARVRRPSKRYEDDDEDWVPDSDVQKELSAMSGAPTYRPTRQKPMEIEPEGKCHPFKLTKASPVRNKVPVREKKIIVSQPASGTESSVVMANTQTTLSTSEAAAELHQLRSRVSMSPDEQWRTLDARDRILRAWGGAGSRVQVGGATIGTCPDMCPEKELLHRQAEYQVMTLETYPDSDGQLEAWRAVKQYSRSSADQEIPMCYELRPAAVLMRTCTYLLHEIADTRRQVTLADWFHFMWDRLRGIRKDITQQALCCAESIYLVEMCARFHAHCAARLADLEHTQFDQKLNTDNLAKCLQTLKHMYADVGPEDKPREAEFRGYIALLNLGDANFLWEVKQLPQNIRKSEPITFAIQIFNALDNNNYVRFFRLVNNRATYLQACILLRYFNDVRARALARIVKAYAPRGGSRYPAEEVMNSLSFESIESMKSFINHYGLRFSKDESEVVVILDRNQFIEDMDPYPVARAINLIESKRQSTVGEVIAGGPLPSYNYNSRAPYSSFNKDGKLKDTALTAEDQQYNTINDSNKDVQGLKAEIQKIVQGGRVFANTEKLVESKIVPVVKPETRMLSPGKLFNSAIAPTNEKRPNESFSFQPAIPVAPTEVIKNSPDKIFGSDTKSVYSFSKPQETTGSNLFVATDTGNIFKLATQGKQALFDSKPVDAIKVFGRKNNENQEPYQNPQTLFKLPEQSNIFKIPETAKAGERKSNENQDSNQNPQTLFKLPEHSNIFKIPETAKAGERKSNENQDSNQNPQTLFKLPEHSNIFKIPETAKAGERKSNENQDPNQNPQTLFKLPEHSNLFKIPESAKTGESNSNIFGNVSNKTIGNKNVFSKTKDEPHNSTTKETSVNIFAKAISTQEIPKPPSNIFGSFSKPGQLSNSNNIFAKPETDRISKPKTFSIPNGDTATNILSPGSLFKSAINADSKGYSIFQSKNKAPSVADNIFNSVNAPKTSVYDFNQNGDQTENYTQTQPLDDDRADKKRERKIQEQMRHEEELKRQEEERRKEEILKQKRQEEEERRKEEERRRDEERRKQEEIKKLEEKRKREEERLQEELKKKLEEERKAEIKRKAEEEDRKFKDRVAKESAELIEELVNEVRDETVREILTEEVDKMKKLMAYADVVSEEIWTELCDEISQSEMTAENFWTDKLKKKWFYIWRKQFARNFNRRTLLEDTPVWLTENTPVEEAVYLRRLVESSALRNMNAIHRGYKFTGEMRQLPTPESYNIMEIIKSPLLKRMKHINYPYDKCFFWKVTLISPDEKKYIYRKIELKKWLLDVFSDKKEHDSSESLIHVEKQSWNNLMNFAIAVSLTTKERRSNCGEALEGTNGLLFYATEKDHDVVVTIQETLKQKYPYQTVPIAVLLPKTVDLSTYNAMEQVLKNFANQNIISDYRIFLLDPQNIFDSLNTTTKSALKWLAKKYPQTPPLETDYLKSICQRYLGNEIWYTLKSERDTRMNTVLKNLHKLVNCYNAAVDKLTESITNEDLFNYTSFPLEFKQYLDQTSPYPKPYEFIPTNARNSENTSAIKVLMKKLKLPCPVSEFHPRSVISMQEHIRKYCNQIGWFENTEEVVCKVVATLPNEFSDLEMTSEQFNNHFEHYDLIDFLNIIVYEKINRLNTFDNRFAVYERSALENYRNSNWLYETEVLTRMKHKVLKYEDELDMFIEAKRRKIAVDSMECLMLEDKDCTMVEENIKATDESISQYTNCKEAVQQLEKQIDDERQKSIELEKMLKAALSKV